MSIIMYVLMEKYILMNTSMYDLVEKYILNEY